MIEQRYPLVSVVLATFNGARYLHEQVDSLLGQTYPNLEIIAIDDASTDETVTILRNYEADHANMKVYVNETNVGFIKNFERGCFLAAGEFIAPCDQDDYWLPGKIKRKMEMIGTHAMIYCDSDICDEKLQKTGTKISDLVVCRNWYSCLEYAIFARIYGHTLLFRRSLFEKSCPFIDVIPHDWWLAFYATLQGGFAFLDESYVLYRQHASNVYGVVNRKKIVAKDAKTIKTTEAEKLKMNVSREEAIRKRVSTFCQICPDNFIKEKEVLRRIYTSYKSFSISNNFLRMITFFQNYKFLLATKKRSRLRKYLFCLKMFVTIK